MMVMEEFGDLGLRGGSSEVIRHWPVVGCLAQISRYL